MSLERILLGPFGHQPYLVLLWQVLLGAGLFFLLRFGRAPLAAVLNPPARITGRTVGPVLRNPLFLIGLGLLLPLAELFTGGYLLNVTYNVGLYVLLAVGLNLVVGFTGLLDLGYVAFFAVGAYTYALLASGQLYELFHRTVYILVPTGAHPVPGFHVSMWLVLPLAGLMAAGFGVLIGLPTLRLRGDYLAIVTLGFGEITRIFVNNLDEPVNITNGPRGVYDVDPIWLGNYDFGNIHNQLLGFRIPPFLNYYYVVLALILLTVFFVSRLAASRVGRAWTAIREDEVAAEVAGINTRNLKLLAYASGGFFGGMAGAVFAAGQHFISPESFQLFLSILVLCMVVVGGMGSIPGSVVGAIAIGGPYFLSAQLQSLRILLFGLVLVAMVTLRPQGILPSVTRRRELQATADDHTGLPHAATPPA